MNDLSGQTIKGYELGDQIGAGGFGAVYRAHQPSVGREVAIKVILPQHANHPDFIRRFETEAQLVARLEHPHIVPLYDYWREPDGAYLVIRWLRGGSLKDSLERGAWELPAAARLLDQVTGALAVAHRQGVVHRDIKPANILLDGDGNAYLSDFGIASDPGRTTHDGGDEMTTGSFAYMPPEQVRNEPPTPAGDIYSLGVVMYEVLTGEHPFPNLDPATQMIKHLTEPLPPLHERLADLPPELSWVIQRATAKDPAERYPDALAFAAAFHEAASASAAVAAPTIDLSQFEVTNPYKGLRAFQESDANDFFGREALTEVLLARLNGTAHPSSFNLHNFLAVVGPSGSGKSSVVKAGVVPALRRGALPGSENWFIVEMMPGARPLEELAESLLRVAVNPPKNLLDRLRRDDSALAAAIHEALPADESTELVLVVDQFEEAFTLAEDKGERARFLGNLFAAVNDPGSRFHLIVTLRADFYDRPLLFTGWGELMRQFTEVVLPLSSGELARAIQEPAEQTGVRWETGLVSAIVADVSEQPGALPLLQYALTELFERRDGRLLTKEAYQSIGGVLGALARRADEVHDSLDEAGKAAARQLFLRLVTLGEGTEDTRRRVLRSELESLTTDHRPLTTVIETFGKSRLLSFDRDPTTRGPTVEVAHEALIRQWKQLREWLDAGRADVRLERLLANAAAEWQSANRENSFLLQGARLSQFASWAAETQLALTQEERTFLDASIAEWQARETEEAARRQRELDAARRLAETEHRRAEEQARAARQLRQRAVYLTVVLVMAVIAAAAAIFLGQQAVAQQQTAESASTLAVAQQSTAESASTQAIDQRTLAEAASTQAIAQQSTAEAERARAEEQTSLALLRQVVAQGVGLLDSQFDLALLFSVEGNHLADTAEMKGLLVNGLEHNPALQAYLRGHADTVYGVAVSPDGKLIASASADNTIRLWDVATRQTVATLAGHTAAVRTVAFSPDGQTLISGSDDQTILLWDVATQKTSTTFKGHTGIVYGVAVSPDGKLIASASGDKTVRLWDVAQGQLMAVLEGHVDAAWSVAFSPDGKLLASGGGLNDKTIILWDVATHQASKTLTGHLYGIFGLAFSPDGTRLASAGEDNVVIVWDVEKGEPIGNQLKGHRASVTSVAFRANGETLISASADGTLIEWSAGDGGLLRRFIGHSNAVQSVAVDSGALVISGSADGTLILWDTSVRQPLGQILNGHTAVVRHVAYRPDGKLLASAANDAKVILWDTSDPKSGVKFLASLEGAHESDVNAVAFSPDGLTLADGGRDGKIALWDVSDPQNSKLLGEPVQAHADRVWGLAFTPDGKWLASGSENSEVKIWRVTGDSLELAATLTDHTNTVRGVVFSPNGKLLASAARDTNVILWDVSDPASPRLMAKLEDHTLEVSDVAFSPDGAILASSSEDRTIILWDVATGEKLATLAGHTFGVRAVSFSPDGKLLASGSQDATVLLWDVATRQPIGAALTGHNDWVRGVAFSPAERGKWVASGSSDTKVIVWDVDFASWQDRACNIAARNFTRDEWEFYFPGQPYRVTCGAYPAGN